MTTSPFDASTARRPTLEDLGGGAKIDGPVAPTLETHGPRNPDAVNLPAVAAIQSPAGDDGDGRDVRGAQGGPIRENRAADSRQLLAFPTLPVIDHQD